MYKKNKNANAGNFSKKMKYTSERSEGGETPIKDLIAICHAQFEAENIRLQMARGGG